MPSSRTISANGLDFFVVEEGQGPLVLLCHGWPELSYSWRHQIPAIAEGHWYAEPEPVVTITGPSAAHAAEKAAFETEHLDRWFGA